MKRLDKKLQKAAILALRDRKFRPRMSLRATSRRRKTTEINLPPMHDYSIAIFSPCGIATATDLIEITPPKRGTRKKQFIQGGV